MGSVERRTAFFHKVQALGTRVQLLRERGERLVQCFL